MTTAWALARRSQTPDTVIAPAACVPSSVHMFLTIFFSLASSALTPQAQDQPGWPCMGNVDPVYIRSAEATGGKVSLFKRSEMAKGAAAVIAGSQGHEQIVVRAGGELDEGAYEFDVPIDSTIESVHFFVSMQCLQSASLHRPSGEALRLEDTDVEHHAFEAVRLFTVKTPAPGGWKVRVAGCAPDQGWGTGPDRGDPARGGERCGVPLPLAWRVGRAAARAPTRQERRLSDDIRR